MPCDPSMADKASQNFTHRKRGAKTIARFQCKSLRMLPCLKRATSKTPRMYIPNRA